MATTETTAAAKRATDQQTVRLALIGAGGIAKVHAGAIKDGGTNLSLVAVADVARAAADELAAGHEAKAFGTPDDMFAAIEHGDVQADAVLVCTPPAYRVPAVEAANRLGLHVLLEKPLAMNVEDGRRLVTLAEQRSDLVRAVAYCHRFAPAINEMKRRVAAGEIGRLTRFENTFAFHHQPMSERWFSDPAVSGGGAFIDTGCHSLDIFRYLVGPAEAVGAVLDRDWPGRGESEATVLVKCAEGGNAGVAGVILAGWLEPERFVVRLTGTNGAFEYDYMKPLELVRIPPAGDREVIAVEDHNGRFAGQLEHFALACLGQSPEGAPPLATFADGLATAEVVAAVGRHG